MTDNVRVNLLVSADTKDQWDQAVEDDDVAESLSQLVRLGVNQYISADTGLSEGSQTVDLDDTELTTRVQRVESKIDQINAKMENVVLSVAEERLFCSPKQAIMSVLPTAPDVDPEDREMPH